MTPFIKNKLIQLSNQRLEHLLLDSPTALDKLHQHQNKHIKIEIAQWHGGLLINSQGILKITTEFPDKFDLLIQLSGDSLFPILKDPSSALSYMHIQGNPALAKDLGFVAKSLKPDLEEILSQFVGEILAHRTTGLIKDTLTYAKSLANVVKTTFSEYLTEEQNLLVNRYEFDEWRASVNSLQKKIADLENQMSQYL